MPDALSDVVRAWPCASFTCIAADNVVPSVVLEEPNCLGEEAGCDEVEEASTDHEEDLEFGCVTTTGKMSDDHSFIVNQWPLPIDQVADCTARCQSANDSKREGRGW